MNGGSDSVGRGSGVEGGEDLRVESVGERLSRSRRAVRGGGRERYVVRRQ